VAGSALKNIPGGDFIAGAGKLPKIRTFEITRRITESQF
jgi:hypothetical protein